MDRKNSLILIYKHSLTTTHLETLALHQKGMKVDEIAEVRELRSGTITSHLEILLENS